MSNLCGGSALWQSVHLYKLCLKVSFWACLTRSGRFAEQAVHVALFVASLWLLNIFTRAASNAEHANVLWQTAHSTLAFSSEGFVLSIMGRPPLTPCAAPAAPVLHSILLYSTLGVWTVESWDMQGVVLPVLLYSNKKAGISNLILIY